MKNTQDPFQLMIFPFSRGGDGREFIILFCNKTYFLHINSEPLTRFIVRTRNRIAVFGIAYCFFFCSAFISIRNIRDDRQNTAVLYVNI